MENLRASFPGADERALRRMARRSCEHLIMVGAEVLCLPRLMHFNRFLQYMDISQCLESFHHVSAGKPCLLLTGHFGNWEMVGYSMAAMGFPPTSIARRLDNPYLNEHMLALRERTGQKILFKQGMTQADDTLPRRYFDDPSVLRTAKGHHIDREKFAEMKADLRADEGTAGPLVIELSASYRQVNLRPLVSKLAVDDGQPSGPTQPIGTQAGRPSRGKRTVSWQASDPNRDDLVFDLYYRAVGENEWKELKKDIKGQPAYEWDVERVPDGYYLVRLVAADRLARSPQETLEGEMVTLPVLIDNRPPEVLGLEAKAQEDNSFVITGLAKDSYSNIAAMLVSLDSQDWLPVFPLDGILDATTEEFFYRTEPLAKGEHVLVFAATDDGGNAGSEKIVVVVK
jgi:hypothetical protein